jgi:hypothetical protein
MNIEEQFERHKVTFTTLGSNLVINCPFCDKAMANGERLANFHINPATGHGTCSDCRITAELPEIIKQLGITDEDIEPSAMKRKRKNTVAGEEDWIVEEPLEIPIDTSQFKPISSNELLKILGLTIKKDDENKLITFLCELSAYTENAQLNISFNAPSSTGKSYIPTEIANLFPQEDVIELGYCSPTAFFHDKSKGYDKEKNELVVDLSRKILIFLDQPHTLLLQHLRPLLSHDKKEIRLKITDKAQKGGLRTKNVILRGFPAVIFCTAGLKIDEQETTRFLLLSPQTDREKIRAAIYEKIRKETNNDVYRQELEAQPERKLLKERIRAIKQEHVVDIRIGSREKIEEAFFGKNRTLKPRHQRDIGRILSLIKALALLNVWFRERVGAAIVANDDDIEEAFKIWDGISESQEFNLPPYVYSLFKEVIEPAWIEKKGDGFDEIPGGLTRREITQRHIDVYGRVLPEWMLRVQILPMLENAGLIAQEPDPNDKRKVLVYPTTLHTISPVQNYREMGGGVKIDEVENNSETDGGANEMPALF